MRRADREERLETIKRLGRIAFRIMKDGGDLVGALTREGEDKHLRLLEDGLLSIELITPHPRSTNPTDFSELEIREHGRKVLVIRWNGAGLFKAVTYEPGGWARVLLDWPDPVPFD